MRGTIESVSVIDAIIGLAALFGGLMVVVGVAALLLYWRDAAARAAGKTPEQIQAASLAVVELHSTLHRSIPGVLIILMGTFLALERLQERDPESVGIGVLLVIIGFALILLLARKNWQKYLELKRLS